MTFIDLLFCWLLSLSPTHPVEADQSSVQAPSSQAAGSGDDREVRVVKQGPVRISNGF